jgi:hypothetical protein
MTAWDIGDEDIWRLAVLILELPKENSSQPGSKDSRYWLGLLRPVLIVEDEGSAHSVGTTSFQGLRHVTVNQAVSQREY